MTLRLGLIGRGRWGRNIERTLIALPDVAVIPIGRDEPRPRDLDGVLIATPCATHAELALPYIAHGIATFIEKPMATSVRDAERIREAAYLSGAVVSVGHIHLHNPAFRTLLGLLPSLGAIRYALCETTNRMPRQDASILWDWLPHHLSMAQTIFGCTADSASAWPLEDAPQLQAASARFLFGGVPWLSTISWLSHVRRQSLTVCCDNATIVFDDKAEPKLVRYNDDGEAHPAYSPELPLTLEMEHFIQRVRSGAVDHTELDQSLAIVSTIAAAERSISKGSLPIAIEPDPLPSAPAS